MVRQRSVLVTVLGWCFLLLSGLATPLVIVFGLLAAPPGPLTWNAVTATFILIMAVPPASLVASIAFLRRRNWARIYFLALLIVAVLFACFEVIMALRTAIGSPAANGFGMGMLFIDLVYFSFYLAVSVWLGIKLSSAGVRGDFVAASDAMLPASSTTGRTS
jgi:hypothetical protein